MNFTPNVTYFCGTEQQGLDVKPFYLNSNIEREKAV
jgi:hypothetical protein